MDPIQHAVTLISSATLDKNILSLLQIGWYVPQRIRLRTVYDLAKLATAGQDDAATQIIALFFRKHRRALEDYLADAYPGQELIGEVFRCHEKQLYTASVLATLAATRSACIKNNVKIENIVRSAYANNISINKIMEQNTAAGGFFDARIREMHLSGQRTAGETESLKAIGLLAFITDFIKANG